MTDEHRPFYVPNSTQPAPKQPLPRELLFEFRHDGRWYRCELIDHGPHGIEAAFTQPERDYLYSRRFDARMDPTRTPRELAVQWAEEERKAIGERQVMSGMSKYTFGLPVTLDQLQAIGMVAAEWSYLESVVDAAIWTLAGIANEDVGAAITTHLTLRIRLDMLETIMRLSNDGDEPETRLSELRHVRKAIDALATRRNEVIHGRWVRGDYGSPLTYTVQARGTLKRTKRGIPALDIQELAREIAEHAAKLLALFKIYESDFAAEES